MTEQDFTGKIEIGTEDVPMQLIVLTDENGISYEYYGAPFRDREPRIKSLYVGPILSKDDVLDYLEFGPGGEEFHDLGKTLIN
jgi:hypothetical protein